MVVAKNRGDRKVEPPTPPAEGGRTSSSSWILTQGEKIKKRGETTESLLVAHYATENDKTLSKKTCSLAITLQKIHTIEWTEEEISP